MSSVEQAGPEPTGRRGKWWAAAVQWRNWPLLVKLGMVLVVPVVSALVLGVLRVQTDVELADSYNRIERVAVLRAQFVPVLSAIQHERNEAVRSGGQFQLQLMAEVTDKSVQSLLDLVDRDPELSDAASGWAAVERGLDSLPAARRQVTGGGDGLIVLTAYNAVINTVLEFDRSLVGRFPDENLAGTSIGLSELLGIREQVALEQAIGSLALRDRALPAAARQWLVEADVRLDDKLDDFRSQAPPDLAARYEAAIQNPNVTSYQEMVEALRTTDPSALPFGQPQWEATSSATIDVMTDVTGQAATDLRSDSAALAESISNRAGLESVLLLTMVLLAAGIGGGLGRYLLRSVGLLRRTALDVAHTRLPAAVASIRAGEGAKTTIEPVPLKSTEEFGQLARAFDAVNDQAVRSAAEEASLRSNLAHIFTNLSRRSQGLVERQLRLMEQLEQKTEDPDQLENLFKIDHLATRMRRNNENLMVLSGTGLLRRFTEPMPLPDVLRAAISEVEHYQRAIVRSVPDVRIAGYAAGDLIRSISELIENATAFSPPDAEVTVVSRLQDDGSAVVDIIDQGVGMGDKELRDANQRMTGGGGVDVPISRQMGLFVVGRLTARHDIHVRLIPRSEGGLCASVLVPAGLVNIADPAQTAAFEMPWSTGGAAHTSSRRATPMAVSWLEAAHEAETSVPLRPRPPGAADSPKGGGVTTTSSWLQTGRPTSSPAPKIAGTTAAGLPKRAGTTAAGLPKRGGTPTNEPTTAPAPDQPEPAPAGNPANGLPKRGDTQPEPATADSQPPDEAGTGKPTPAPAGIPEPVAGLQHSGGADEPDSPSAAGQPTTGQPAPTSAGSPGTSPHQPSGTGQPAPASAGNPTNSLPKRGDPSIAGQPTSAPAGSATASSHQATGTGQPAPATAGNPTNSLPKRGDTTSQPTSASAGSATAGPRQPTGEAAGRPELDIAAVLADSPTVVGTGEVYEPAEVVGQLESVGIIVTLPDLPAAATPASILFADNTAGGGGGGELGFSWLRTRAGVPGVAVQEAAPAVTTGSAGLPKRVPRGHLGPTRGQPPPPAATRNAARARGFLSGFQAGIRQSENRKGETGP